MRGHYRRDIAMGAKAQVNILALEISPKVKLSGIERTGWNKKFSLCDDAVAVGKRFAAAFRGNVKAHSSIVDAADERNKSLNGA